jgi:hypothetical protein
MPEWIEDDGALDDMEDLLAKIREELPNLIEESMDKVCHWAVERMKDNIKKQRYPHDPLSAPYLAWKKKKGLDERILIATGEYVDSIGTEKVDKAITEKGESSWAITLPDTIHSGSGLPMHVLAHLLEFGNPMNNLPARPHWRPMLKEAKEKAYEIISESIKELIARAKKGT